MLHCKHVDCKYRSISGDHNRSNDCCLYILMEYKPRPCPAGDCPGVYQPRERAPKFDDKIWDLYFCGWTDKRIAEYYGVQPGAVAFWRAENDLPNTYKHRGSGGSND